MTIPEFFNALSQLFTSSRLLDALTATGLFGLYSLTIIAPLVSFIALGFFAVTKKVFYEKFAHQYLLLTTSLFVLTAGATLVILPLTDGIPYYSTLLSMACTIALIVPLPALYFSWKNKILRAFLVPVTVTSLVFAFSVMYEVMFFYSPFAFVIWLSGVTWHNLPGPLLVLVLFFLPIILLPLAYAASVLWPMIRRNRDDYGRDYYVFSIRHAAKGSLCSTALCIVTVIIPLFFEPSVTLEARYYAVLVFALLSLCCILWAIIARSAVPLRHKPAAAAAFIVLTATYAFTLLALTNVYTKPGM